MKHYLKAYGDNKSFIFKESGRDKRFVLKTRNMNCDVSEGFINYSAEKIDIVEQQTIDNVCRQPNNVEVTRCTEPGCNKTFKKKGYLKDHLAIHKGEKLFICNVPGCEKRFVLLKYLRVHQKRHMKQKSDHQKIISKTPKSGNNEETKPPNHHNCNVAGCNKAYSSGRSLSRHYLTAHSDKRPFECGINGCQKNFKRSDYLKKHQQIVHFKLKKVIHDEGKT
jgi:uncharacterized Zn-finger protein